MAVIDIEYGKALLAEYSGEAAPGEGAPKGPTSMEWEMVMQNSSIGHEYARLELDLAEDVISRESLIEKMENFKRAYYLARRYLKRHNPLRLETLEAQLIDQKVHVFGNFHA